MYLRSCRRGLQSWWRRQFAFFNHGIQHRDGHARQQRGNHFAGHHSRWPASACVELPTFLRPDQCSFQRRHNLERGVQFGAQLDHGADRAVLLFGELDRVFQCLRRNIDPADDVVGANLGEDLRRVRRLVSFHLDFVAGDLLALLAQDGDDIERRAARQRDGDKFDGLRSGVTGSVVKEEMVAGTAGSNELPMSTEGLSQSYACRDHVVLRASLWAPWAYYIRATRINAVTGRTVTGIRRGMLGISEFGKTSQWRLARDRNGN